MRKGSKIPRLTLRPPHVRVEGEIPRAPEGRHKQVEEARAVGWGPGYIRLPKTGKKMTRMGWTRLGRSPKLQQKSHRHLGVKYSFRKLRQEECRAFCALFEGRRRVGQ